MVKQLPYFFRMLLKLAHETMSFRFQVLLIIIATVDKFAQVALNEDTFSIFGLDSGKKPPELIIQDELHRVCQQIPADRLRHILRDFRPIAFHPAPVLLGVGTIICDAFSAELILFQPGLDIYQLTDGHVNQENRS